MGRVWLASSLGCNSLLFHITDPENYGGAEMVPRIFTGGFPDFTFRSCYIQVHLRPQDREPATDKGRFRGERMEEGALRKPFSASPALRPTLRPHHHLILSVSSQQSILHEVCHHNRHCRFYPRDATLTLRTVSARTILNGITPYAVPTDVAAEPGRRQRALTDVCYT